ncbi:lysophospholipid acyltransferase family protein [Aquisalinus flavus]|uniref:1-acyl-sn-glycerol-3-phosphate acyltransferase n=1 Tax=Aquisalinus flavus TaxID=1526572 RepID=A0A8J2Y414_9PROT|nr:lysophospholipid acyltransferase family protein [Aquisalinus flavus]MBD0425841.1 1-acyl-sn-glycerol-3-phosphate acyltransferase [Aquisalinus flavus]UNE48557.1 1-acyl-sn-glycerol-3-phosphate acyltransferase [Aquisalinus flavus]GGD12819.1 1-acyl-sn-glycerol-3-phosphate acyltransferase [Aquisalinus flavus]
MRSILFQLAYWLTSIFFALFAVPLLLVPHRGPLMLWILLYTRTMCFWMEHVAGIRIEVTGRERLPDGPCIIAAKHQSWGDGFIMFSQFHDLAFVTGDHLEKFPLVGGILKKMGAIVVNNCGGPAERGRLLDTAMKQAREDGRRILIYPEGHLSKIGERHRYRKGVYHMYRDYDVPVVPVATNLGLCWPQQSGKVTPGIASVEFLEPIAPGMAKDDFMLLLESRIETRSLELLPPEHRPLITAAPVE